MEPLERLFNQWTQDLAPGIPDPNRVVMERILYRSGKEKSQLPLKGFKGDRMDIDLNDFTMPLAQPQTNRKSPGTGTRGREQDKKSIKDIDRIRDIKDIRQIEALKEIKSIESIKGIQGIMTTDEQRETEERRAKERPQDTGERQAKKKRLA